MLHGALIFEKMNHEIRSLSVNDVNSWTGRNPKRRLSTNETETGRWTFAQFNALFVHRLVSAFFKLQQMV